MCSPTKDQFADGDKIVFAVPETKPPNRWTGEVRNTTATLHPQKIPIENIDTSECPYCKCCIHTETSF